MFIQENNIENAMFDRLSLFGLGNKKDYQSIFYSVIKNDKRVLKEKFFDFTDITQLPIEDYLVHYLHVDVNSKCFKKKKLNYNNWKYEMVNVIKEIEEQYKEHDDFVKCILRNYWMVLHGLCPLINYAFDQNIMVKINNENSIHDLMLQLELSTVYLLRKIKIPTNSESLNETIYSNNGAYSEIILSRDKKLVYKKPKNIAAKKFVNRQEVLAVKQFSKTILIDNIAKVYNFDEETGVIIREFIEGKSGEYFLFNGEFVGSANQYNKLKKIYYTISNVSKKIGIFLDIHPQNFIWSYEENKWYLIDLGPIPVIGQDYYDLDNFQKYFQKTWLDRERRKKKYPIRSVDI